MENPEDVFFKTTNSTDASYLKGRYGITNPWELFFKLAEYKNFDGAREIFNRWDDDFVKKSDRHLNAVFVHSEWAKEARPTYIAHCFLMRLIREKNVRDPWAEELDEGDDIRTMRRILGILPRIDIRGIDFTVDWSLRELRETENPANWLNIKEMELDRVGGDYVSYYNVEKKQLQVIAGDIVELPENVMLMYIPNERELDPVVVARESGLDDLALLNPHPIKKSLKAYLYPLEETELAKLVRDNIARKERSDGNHKIGR
jgi:hypothetical protein